MSAAAASAASLAPVGAPRRLRQRKAGHACAQQQDATDWPSAALSSPPAPQQYSYAVLLSYDGTGYWGFQLQPAPQGRRGRPTVQLRLEGALCRVTGQPREALKLQAAGRTDTGVHARGQVAQFFCARPHDPAALLRSLNALLPADVRALGVREVPPEWNVRYALRKTYCYDLHLDAVADPFLHRWRHHPRRPHALRLDAMAHAASLLAGTHNFSCFANVSPDGARKDPVRTILRYQLLPLEGGARLEVEGTGFLYKQVRHMTGALLAVGAGALRPDDVAAALAAGEQAAAGPQRHAHRRWMVAEAKGLCLKEVVYAPWSAWGEAARELAPAAGAELAVAREAALPVTLPAARGAEFSSS